MNTPTVPFVEQKRLRAHFGFTRLPFRKNVPAEDMFDSSSQRELLAGLIAPIKRHERCTRSGGSTRGPSRR